MTAYKGKEKYIFVSYAHKDSEKVLPVIENMQRAGFRVWYDTGIEAGTEWPAYIEESLEKSSVVIAFLSHYSVESVNCRNEINYALLKQKEMLVIYLEDTELKYGLGLQLNALQSLYRSRHTTEKSFLDELMKAKILQECRRIGASFEEMRRVSAKNGKRRAVLKTVLIADEKHEEAVLTENKRRDDEAISLMNEEKNEERNAEIVQNNEYNKAVALMEKGKYAEAETVFNSLGSYKDSVERSGVCSTEIVQNNEYNKAVALMEKGKYAEAEAVFNSLGGYKDSVERSSVCSTEIVQNNEYNKAVALMEKGKYAEAEAVFNSLGSYKDSVERSGVCSAEIVQNNEYNKAVALMENGEYAEAIAIFETLGGYKDSSEKITVCKSEMFLLGKYDDANILLNQKNYAGAYEAFSGLGNYRDSVEKAQKAKKLIKKSAFLEKFQMGNTVKFGSYPQENNEKEAIEWQVLDVRSGRALLISKYALDCRKYNTTYTKVTWETCGLRKWLNQDFFESAFSENERSMILTTAVPSVYGKNTGKATQDKLFLLSITEAKRYFPSGRVRVCKPTVFATERGAYLNSDNGNCWWWLRSPGISQSFASFVDDDGEISGYGGSILVELNAIRPAFWIDLNG